MNDLTVGIIGGKGSMGSFFARVLQNDCKNLVISDCNTEVSNRELARISDVIIISVPIEETVPVIEEITPEITEDKLLMDVTSLKCKPIEAMLGSKADVIGMHPMFDPSANTIANQTILLSPARDRRNWMEKITSLLSTKKVNLKIISPDEHDKLMSIVQSLVHFNLISIGMTLSRSQVEINELLEYASPLQKVILSSIGRVFDQSSALYGNILLGNPNNQTVIENHLQSIQILSNIVRTRNWEKFVSTFQDTSNYFADFKMRATEESNFVINELVNFNARK